MMRIHALEIGCGTGFVMEGLGQKFRKYRLSGADIHVAGMQYARRRLSEANFYQLDATHMPFHDEYEAIGMFDSLEHIQDDEGAMRGVHQALKPGGYFFVTVPQHPSLWSNEDVLGGHKRRYTRGEPLKKLRNSGFQVVSCTSFVTSLLPLLFLSRILGRSRAVSEEDFFQISEKQLYPGPVINALASYAMALDSILIKMGCSLPAGGSLLAVGRRDEDKPGRE